MASAAEVATRQLIGQGLAVRSAPGAIPVVLEYGNVTTGLLGGLGLGLLPGKVGKHGFAVVDAEPAAEGVILTIAHVAGYRVNTPVLAAIAGTLDELGSAGVLLDAGSPISAHDLPESSAAHPKSFAAGGGVSGVERWMTT